MSVLRLNPRTLSPGASLPPWPPLGSVVGCATSLALVLIHFSCGLTGGRVGSRRTPSPAARRAPCIWTVTRWSSCCGE
jgi:hypothetical protein